MSAIQLDNMEEPQQQQYVETLKSYLWSSAWPIGYGAIHLSRILYWLLQYLLMPIAFLLQPFISLGRFILACILLPFNLLAKFNALYNFLGVAAVVGVIIGLTMGYLYGALCGILCLGAHPEAPARLRTAKQYRTEKQKQKAEADAPSLTSGMLSPAIRSTTILSPRPLLTSYDGMSDPSSRKGKRSKGLLDQTIIEEVDSDY